MLNSRVALFISRVANFNSRVAISKKEDHPGRPTRQTRPTLSPGQIPSKDRNKEYACDPELPGHVVKCD